MPKKNHYLIQLIFFVLLAVSVPANGFESTKNFVDALSLIHSGNESIKSLIQAFEIAKSQKKWEEACEIYGDYFLQRTVPKWSSPEIDGFVTSSKEEANRYKNGDFLFEGSWFPLGAQIDYGDMSHGINWNAELNRNYRIAKLAYQFNQTKDESFAEIAVKDLRQWLAQAPALPSDSGNNPYHPYWQQLNTSRRVGFVWPHILRLLHGSKYLTGKMTCLLSRSLVQHAQQLMKFPITSTNWAMHQNLGLYFAGILLVEHGDSPRWRWAVLKRLKEQIEKDFYPDGTQIELAYGYGASVIINALKIRDLAALNPFVEPFPQETIIKMEKFYDYSLFVSQPNRLIPPLNDTLSGWAPGMLSSALSLFPKRKDYRWLVTGEGEAPGPSAYAFPYAGHYVMRSGWTPDANYLHYDGGLFGYMHQHEDKLSVLVSAYGRELLIEAGVHTYDPKPERRYTVSTFAHNTTAVDGYSQNRRKAGIQSGTWVHPYPYVPPPDSTWITNNRFDYVSAIYDSGYGPSLTQVQHRRSIIFLKPAYWVIFDRYTPETVGLSHHYESFYHLNAEAWRQEGNIINTQNSDANLMLWPISTSTLKTAVVKGKLENPNITNWSPDHLISQNLMQGWGRVVNAWKPIPTVIHSFAGANTILTTTLIYPYSGTITPAIKSFRYCPKINSESKVNPVIPALTCVELEYAGGKITRLLETGSLPFIEPVVVEDSY